MKSHLAALLLCAALAAVPGRAFAGALEDFERAETAYREQRYATAATLLEAILAEAAVHPIDVTILAETRKVLGACYLFLQRDADAELQFRMLLELDPEYRLDPVAFPRAVVERFDAVRAQIEDAQDEAREAAREAAERRASEAEEARAATELRYRALYDVASRTPVLRRNSRIVALLPFGIGQFQNGRRRLGRFFGIAEGATLALHFGGLVWYRAIADEQVADDDLFQWSRSIDSARALNWAGLSAFGGLVLAGALEAEIRFVPTRESSRPRELPEPLRPTVSVLPAGRALVLHVRF